MTFTLRREQWIACPIGEVFAFFADAQNLEKITPPWLGFKILSMSANSISEGTVIRSPAIARHTHSLADGNLRVEPSPLLCRRAGKGSIQAMASHAQV